MILQVSDPKYADIFAAIYNSANELFATEERGVSDADAFLSQIKNDINFIKMQENGDISAFMSYRQSGCFYELTALYVKKEYQRNGIGFQLLSYLEAQMQNGGVIFVKVLKNAPWAQHFYLKHGFLPLNSPSCLADGNKHASQTFYCHELRAAAASLHIVEKPYSSVLYKA